MKSDTDNPKTETIDEAVAEEETDKAKETDKAVSQLNEIFKILVELKFLKIPGIFNITLSKEYKKCILTISALRNQWIEFRAFSLDNLKEQFIKLAKFHSLGQLGFEVIERLIYNVTFKSFSIEISNCSDIERIYEFCKEKKKTLEIDQSVREWVIVDDKEEDQNGGRNTSVEKTADSPSEEGNKKSKIRRIGSYFAEKKDRLFNHKERRAEKGNKCKTQSKNKFQDGGEESPLTENVRPSQPSRKDSLAASLFHKSTVVIVTEGKLATVSLQYDDSDTANSDPSEQNRV